MRLVGSHARHGTSVAGAVTRLWYLVEMDVAGPQLKEKVRP